MGTTKERVFSVELNSTCHLKTLSLTNGFSDNVLVEGNLGELVQARFAEGVVLEIVCKNGLLRVDLGEGEVKKSPHKPVGTPVGDENHGVYS